MKKVKSSSSVMIKMVCMHKYFYHIFLYLSVNVLVVAAAKKTTSAEVVVAALAGVKAEKEEYSFNRLVEQWLLTFRRTR
jgi:hypothetical protein